MMVDCGRMLSVRLARMQSVYKAAMELLQLTGWARNVGEHIYKRFKLKMGSRDNSKRREGVCSMEVEEKLADLSLDRENSSQVQVNRDVQEKWEKEQIQLKSLVICHDTEDWQRDRKLRYIGGVDLSFIKGDAINACAALVVCGFEKLDVVYEDIHMVQLEAPYIPGYLGFRESGVLIDMIGKLKTQRPDVVPDVILVDGNGILHPRRLGAACHIGLRQDIPTVGVAKNLFVLHDEGLSRDGFHKEQILSLKEAGDSFPLQTNSGDVLGVALKTHNKAPKPVFVSVGHRISLETAAWVVLSCCLYRVPEPIRQADIRSRQYLRQHFPVESALNSDECQSGR